MAAEQSNINLDVNSLTTEELRQKLEELKLPLSGSKAVLAKRLDKALTKPIGEASGSREDKKPCRRSKRNKDVPENKGDDDSDDESSGDDKDDDETDCEDDDENEDDDESEDDSDREERRERRKTERKSTTGYKQSMLTFKDVEDALESFSGDGNENVSRWITNFEETAEMCDWTDPQKVIYAKRLLKGSAKLFINFECLIRTWKAIKKALKEEFAKTVNSKQVHRQLSISRKKPDESYQEYIYRMLEIASHADIEQEAKIQYIIDGIPDDETNKTILYGAKTIKGLRKRFLQYEVMQRRNNNKNKIKQHDKSKRLNHQVKENRKDGEQSDKPVKRCFNCGDKKHISADCPDKARGAKCFKCREFGHVASKCTKEVDSNSSSGANKPRVDLTSVRDKKTYKTVKMLGKDIDAIIDSGSDLHLVRSTLYVQLGAPKLEKKTISFHGVGSSEKKTLGRFNSEIIIDGMSFVFNFDVVPDDYTGHDLIIGGELSDHAEIVWKKRQATLTKFEEDNLETDFELSEVNNVGWREIAVIDADHDEDSNKYEVCVEHISDQEIKEIVRQLVGNYRPEKTADSGVKMHIMLQDELPVHQNPRRLSEVQKCTVNKIIDQWLKDKIVRPSVSAYASPIVLVVKKNGEPRLCVDYRGLNKKVIRDRYPLPLIEDQLDRLQDAAVFSTLDLKDGFFHVPIEESSIKYTSFVTPDGQYEFMRVPFGLSNSPAIFQRHIRAVFRDLINDGTVLTYLDDLIIPARDEAENLEKLKRVLSTASKYGLIINWKKCELLVKRVEYLGYIVEKRSIKPSEKKTLAVARFPKPKTVKQVQSFLGLTGYFRKFIPQFAIIARPLSQLLRNGVKFEFGPEQESAYNHLKNVLTENPVLKLYRVGAETELHTDASMLGLGAILLQKDSEDGMLHPIYYASWKTTPTEEKYTSYELEVLAVIKALKKFRVYLLGIQVKIVTDCRAFALTRSKKNTSLRVAHWALLIEEFQYSIEHRPGKLMKHADALSRNPINVLLVQEGRDGLIVQIQKAQSEDSELKNIIEMVQREEETEFVLKKGVLYRECDGNILLVVPRSMQINVIRQAHEKGHFGVKKTEYVLKQEFWFPKMQNKIQKFVNNCVQCLLAERKAGKTEGFLSPIDKGDTPLDTYHIDHLGPMPSTKKTYNHLFVVIDAFTKYTWLYPTKSTTTEEVIVRLNKQAVTFGNPQRIISDRGTAFTSNAFKEYCDKQNIKHTLITTGVPRGNGQVERVNRVVISMLTKLSMPKPAEWHKYVDVVQQFMNSSFHRSVGRTPFELMIGVPMRLKNDIRLKEIIDKEIIEAFDQQRDQLREEAKNNISKIQEENRKTFNKRRKKASDYKVDDVVAIQRTQLGAGLKFHPKFLGPYKVTTVIRNNRYRVEKIGEHEGPNCTSTSSDHMKPWSTHDDYGYETDNPEIECNNEEHEEIECNNEECKEIEMEYENEE